MLSKKATAELFAALSDFDILSAGPYDYKSRIVIRCKTCGAVLDRLVDGIFDNAKAHGGKYACLECKKAYNQLTEVKRRKYRESNRRERERNRLKREAVQAEREAAELERRQKVVERNGAFEYVGNYNGSEGPCDIRCLVCGSVITRNWITLKKGTARCDRCKAIEQEHKQREQKAQKQQQKNEKQEARERAFWSSEHPQMEMKLCKCCGALFISSKFSQVYCSTECMKRINNALGKDRRIRQIAARKRDGITLERLFNRDAGICYLCGEPCDWQDYRETETAFIAGERYPSIDHVKALHDGGTHTWDNVKLAHRSCNTRKR